MNERKSVLFACYGLGIGGIEKCLVNLINVMPEQDFDIDLLIMNPEYDMLPQIRRKVNLIDSFSYILNTEFTMQEIQKRGGLWKHRKMLLPYVEHRVRIKLGLPLWTQFRAIEKEYDIAVAYSQNGLAPYYIMDKTYAKRKVLWYHNGAYERTEKEFLLDQKYYTQYDFVVGVSDFCADVLREKFSFREDQLVVLKNICDTSKIRQDSQLFVPDTYEKKEFHIATVGRMAIEKGPDLALEACRILHDTGNPVCWHWIGDGPQRSEIQSKVKEYGLENSFLLEGNRVNPYPYIRSCDLYVQTSRYESYSMTTMEAQILYKPIVITGVGGMKNLIQNGKNGILVRPNAQAIAEGVRKLMDDPMLRESFVKTLTDNTYLMEAHFEEYGKRVFA